MRKIDRWLGAPACAALTVMRKFRDLKDMLQERRPARIHSILFVKPAEQGATVLSHRALKRAVEIVGRENVFFLVFEENRFILDVMEVIPEENVIAIPSCNFRSILVGTIRALWRTRRLGIDAAVDFEFFARSSAVLTYLSGARVRVGFHSFAGEAPYRGNLMTHRLIYNPHLHISQTYAVMVEALTAPPEDMPSLNMVVPPVQEAGASFTPEPQELERVKTALKSQAGTSSYSPLVLLNANASDLLPLRRWPEIRYVELARRLLHKSRDVHIAFTGAPDEARNIEKLVEAVGSDRCFSMAGKTTLRELLTLYCLADVLVTNDSGPALFATLTPINSITLFGPETPELFGGNTPNTNIIWKNLPCSPCVSAYNNRLSACRNNACMQRITVEEVFSLVCRLCRI